MRYAVQFLLLFFCLTKSVFAIELLSVENLTASPLNKQSIGILRLLCMDQRKFVSFTGREAVTELIQLKEGKNSFSKCESDSLRILDEQQISAAKLQKNSASILRKFEVGGYQVLLITSRSGGGSLLQFHQ